MSQLNLSWRFSQTLEKQSITCGIVQLSVCMITSVAGVHLDVRRSWIVFVEVIDDITVSLTSAAVSTSQPIALTHWGRDKIDAILQTTFSNAISWMKIFEFRLKFHWSLFLKVQLTIFQHWFRQWLGAEQATSHYLNQWWPSSTTHICVTQPQWVNILRFKQMANILQTFSNAFFFTHRPLRDVEVIL